MTIDCITFDLDDTLWECDSVIARAEEALFEWLRQNMPRVTEEQKPKIMIVAQNKRGFLVSGWFLCFQCPFFQTCSFVIVLVLRRQCDSFKVKVFFACS